jgi:NAD(P)-dependent dehydrogenase (short-subunit alcohol dehydrogenase family)
MPLNLQDTPAPSLMLPDLRGKWFVVTGASAGIGRATIEALLANGATCFGLSRETPAINHPDFHPLPCDLRDPAAITHAFAQLRRQTNHLDGVVNVAGTDPKIPLAEGDAAKWDGIVDLNLPATKAGILGLTTGLARELGRDGIRINTVSPGWIFTERQVGEYFSGADTAKHLAHLGNVQSLPVRLQSGDVANHILFYLSEVSRGSTGHNCVVDGGWLLE